MIKSINNIEFQYLPRYVAIHNDYNNLNPDISLHHNTLISYDDDIIRIAL